MIVIFLTIQLGYVSFHFVNVMHEMRVQSAQLMYTDGLYYNHSYYYHRFANNIALTNNLVCRKEKIIQPILQKTGRAWFHMVFEFPEFLVSKTMKLPACHLCSQYTV